ncbi:MAG: class I SAM-dependent methyltransferase [Burkholderiales bacterium]
MTSDISPLEPVAPDDRHARATRPVKLEFSEKYDQGHAYQYFLIHHHGLWRRISNWREQRLARNALRAAGNPASVLDIPCGTGRFWELLAASGSMLFAGDFSAGMLDTASAFRKPDIRRRFNVFRATAFSLPLADNSVECVFCVRFLHHIGKDEDRLALFRELARVSSKTVVVSLWVDGNWQALRRKKLEDQRGRTRDRYQNRFVASRAGIERLFREAGLEIAEHRDFLRFYSMWRFYVLRKPGAVC